MRVLPILFNTEMVRAIIEGRKSCTRRIVKTRRKDACGFYVTKNSGGSFAGIYEYDENESMFDNLLMPPYQPGDILYVRETWCAVGKDTEGNTGFLPGEQYLYKADDLGSAHIKRWHPSIHMPKEAARTWLKVTDVMVEQLQEITIDGIRSEGLFSMAVHAGDMDIALREWKLLWDSTIKKIDLNRYGWNANPWVWVIEFERCEKPNPEKEIRVN